MRRLLALLSAGVLALLCAPVARAVDPWFAPSVGNATQVVSVVGVGHSTAKIDVYQRTRAGWEPVAAWQHPTLFVRGGNSPYVTEACRDELIRQFPEARAHVIAGAGHWVHAEKPEAVLRAIRRYLSDTAN